MHVGTILRLHIRPLLKYVLPRLRLTADRVAGYERSRVMQVVET